MFERVDEAIRVVVDFDGSRVRPVALLRGGMKYLLKQVNLVSESGVGPTKRFFFSVSDAGNAFTLEYNPFDLSWRLKEVWTEG